MPALNIRIQGSGIPVVFLHGFLESSTMWKYLQFPKDVFQCIYVDIPGHGKSAPLKDENASITSLAQSICNELVSKGITTFDLLTKSLK